MSSIGQIQEVRVCDEHRCILLRNSDIWKRFDKGSLRIKEPFTKRLKDPRPDWRGRIPRWAQNISLVDNRYAEDDPRYIVLEAYCHRLANGEVGGATGLVDPKEVLINNTLYIRTEYKNPHCALCESVDMIPLEARFHDSRYKPFTPPLPYAHKTWLRITKKWNQWRDRWAQRGFVRRTIPKPDE